MKPIGSTQLKNLLLKKEGACVSMYVSPTLSHDQKSLQLSMKSQLSRIRSLLHQHYPSEAGTILGSLARLIEHLQEFHLSTGLAIFKSQSFEGVFSVPNLSINRAVVADSFHIRPILTSIQHHDRYAIVVLNTDSTIYFEGSELGVQPIAPPTSGPLVILGEEPLRAGFFAKSAKTHQIIGSIDLKQDWQENLDILFQKTRRIARQWMRNQTSRDIDEYHIMHKKGLASDNLYQTAIAAMSRRVKSLLLEKNVYLVGRINSHTGQPILAEANINEDNSTLDDILDDLAELVIRTGGQVRVVDSLEMPSASPLAATFFPRTPINSVKVRVG